MTSPIEKITLQCPRCGNVHDDWYRPSVNTALDNFDEEYLRECSATTCPVCGHMIKFDMLIVDREGKFVFRKIDEMKKPGK